MKGGVCGRQGKQVSTKEERGGGGEMCLKQFPLGPLTAALFFLFLSLII